MTMYDQQGVTIPMQAGFQLDNPILRRNPTDLRVPVITSGRSLA